MSPDYWLHLSIWTAAWAVSDRPVCGIVLGVFVFCGFAAAYQHRFDRSHRR